MLLRHADQAMYSAKQSGKRRFQVFDVTLDQSLRTLHEQRLRLEQALVAGEFVLYYQPKVDMRQGRPLGAEALLRWQHPEQGLLAPGRFLPPIGHDELIVQIGDWVIEAALTQLDAWHAEGIETDVSINVAVLQLKAPDFIAKLRNAIARHPHVAHHLELEVLETAALEDIAHMTQVIEACHALGLRIALDDFGTGYSSLSYLKRLPIDVIKIDQSFVREILDDPDNQVIVRGIAGLANAFQHDLIAEGVETVEHGRLLLRLGCDLAQGHGISRPLPADEFSTWLRCWRPPQEWLDEQGSAPLSS
ncbi:MAG: putative bifunctional diguanylate cyclase/phosphodiesterase, partial [Rhodocyclaceae bacterium]